MKSILWIYVNAEGFQGSYYTLSDNPLNPHFLWGLEETPLNKGGKGVVFTGICRVSKRSLPAKGSLINHLRNL